MYCFSRAIYRELSAEIIEDVPDRPYLNHERVLRACETAVERLATDRHYFARPARWLFSEIRVYFPICSQGRVWRVVERYMTFADEFLRNQEPSRFDVNGNPVQCRASTRKGAQCQRTPLPHNGYCPSHQHLAETEDFHEYDELNAA